MLDLEWENAEYLERVRARLNGELATGPQDLAQACDAAQGAFPDIVAYALGALLIEPSSEPQSEGGLVSPHESPGRGEWFFTEPSSRLLAHWARGRVLLLGAPSVAQHVDSGLLIDSSPYVAQRFQLGRVEHRPSRVEDVNLSEQFDSVVIDPPWYSKGVVDWIARASRWVRPQGS